MSIIRAPRKQTNFTILSNDVIRDARLSYRASGVLHDILSRPDNWSTNAETLAKARHREGREAIRTALRELQAAGYLVHEKIRDPKTGRISTVSYVYDEPQPTANEAYLQQRASRRKPPGPKNPTSGNPSSGKPGPLTRTEKKDCEEVLKTGSQASSGGQLASESAPTLTRREAPKRKRDPLTRDTAADDAEANRIAEHHGLDPEDAALVTRYLRHDRNAATTAGHMRHISQSPSGLSAILAQAEAWDGQLTAHHENVMRVVEKWGHTPQDARILADRIRGALAIRCDAGEINAAVRDAGYGSPIGVLVAAVDGVVGRRERVRRAGRVGRVVG